MVGAATGGANLPFPGTLEAVQGCGDLVRRGVITITPICESLSETAVKSVKDWAKKVSLFTREKWRETISPDDLVWLRRMLSETTETERAEVLQSTSPAAFLESGCGVLRELPRNLRVYARADDNSLKTIISLLDS